jgi:hypothetical protein
MMNIKLVPQINGGNLELLKSGSILVINGEAFDFSPMSEGSILPRDAINSDWFVGDVDMTDGAISMSLIFPIPPNYSPEQAFPELLTGIPDGPVALPQPLPTMADQEVTLA